MAEWLGGRLPVTQRGRSRGIRRSGAWALTGALLVASAASVAGAATLCVNPGGTGGCQSSISAAVAAAAPGDTITVARGRYTGGIVIDKPLSLIGADEHDTVIDAGGMPTGITIDGIADPGLSGVVVSGFTVDNAQFEGVLAVNASSLTIADNEITGNDASLDASSGTCPGIPVFETLEGFDCGEGIHLSGVDHAIVSGNLVYANAGGILLSDDTGATHDNLITNNVVRDNPYDCGITLASHPPAAVSGSPAPLGVYDNTVAGNVSTRNGVDVEGAGAGVDIFASVPGAGAYGNVVIGNRLNDNGLPGVALHAHAPGQNVDGNVITRNQISGNGADTEDAATPGPTGVNIASNFSPVSGIVVSDNVITRESVNVAVKAPTEVTVRLNRFLAKGIGVDNLGAGSVDARENWWGCSKGPGAPGCSAIAGSGVLADPWLTRPF